MIGQVLALVGSVLVLLAAVGVVGFEDALARMHALAGASILGLMLLLAGAAVNLSDANDVTALALAGVLHVLTSPPASNMLSRAAYLADGLPDRVGVRDEGLRARGPCDDSESDTSG